MTDKLVAELTAACKSLRVKEPLSRHTSWAIGGPADYFAEVGSLRELQALRQVVSQHHLPYFFLGAGSNLLVSDRGIRGLVIHLLGDFRHISFNSPHVTVGAGAWMPTLSKQCAEKGLAGVESLIGVPGTVGGGVVMNAGTREGVLGDVVESVKVLDEQAQAQSIPLEKLGFTYRHSNAMGWWITEATLLLRPEDRSSIMARVESLLQYRTRTQPLATSNCGSVFKNPPNDAAARLIEQAGMKGVAVGGARVSERHANFILNEKQASAQDVRELMTQIQRKVQAQFSVHLEPEVKCVGEWPIESQ